MEHGQAQPRSAEVRLPTPGLPPTAFGLSDGPDRFGVLTYDDFVDGKVPLSLAMSLISLRSMLPMGCLRGLEYHLLLQVMASKELLRQDDRLGEERTWHEQFLVHVTCQLAAVNAEINRRG